MDINLQPLLRSGAGSCGNKPFIVYPDGKEYWDATTNRLVLYSIQISVWGGEEEVVHRGLTINCGMCVCYSV